MKIIRANIKDALSIFEIEKNNFTTDAWTVSQWENEFKDNKFSIIYLLKDKEEVIGYIDFWIMFEQATIAKICIKKEYTNEGLGDKLLKRCLKTIDKKNCLSTSLEVRVSNIKAINLYKKNDFKIILTKKEYYSDGEDCYYMIRSIGDVYER